MPRKIMKRILRKGPLSLEEQARLKKIRAQVMEEFPPKPLPPTPPGIPMLVRDARQRKQMTWYALAKAAGVPNPNTIRDIERGIDTHVTTLQAVANVLGLKLTLVEEPV